MFLQQHLQAGWHALPPLHIPAPDLWREGNCCVTGHNVLTLYSRCFQAATYALVRLGLHMHQAW